MGSRRKPLKCWTLAIGLALACGAGASAVAQSEETAGNARLNRVAAGIRDMVGLSCEMRIETRRFQQTLVGKGSYQQMRGRGDAPLHRLELEFPLDDRRPRLGEALSKGRLEESRATYLQIRGEQHLWISHNLDGEHPYLARINLRRLKASGDDGNAPALTNPTNMPLDGLPGLLDSLAANFKFGRIVQVGGGKKDELIRFQTRGVWKLASIQELGVGAGKLPEQLPEIVEVTLGRHEGRNDDTPAFEFPLEIAFQRRKPGAIVATDVEPIVTMRFPSVAPHRDDLNLNSFQFKPGDQSIVDLTERYLSGRGR